MRILYSGGGTMGSVSPLIAIHQRLSASVPFSGTTADKLNNLENEIIADKNYQAFWIGTKTGLEKEIVKKEGIVFKSISAGKLRRYFDLRNIVDIFKIKIGFFQAFSIIKKFKPDVIVSAGSFVAVPVVIAGWFLRVPSIIHQQDVRPGLANKIMAKFAARITVALDISLKDFSSKKVILAGNPVRQFPISNPEYSGQFSNKSQNLNFKFQNDLPILLVMGGGTGALALNNLILESLPELAKFCNIIHLTGKNKKLQATSYKLQANYKSFEFLGDEIFSAMSAADLIITRAGMSALTELAYLKKSCVIVPIPNSHQEKNAEYFAEKNAGVYLKQNEFDKNKLVDEIKKLLADENARLEMGERINKVFIDYSGEKIINIISTQL
jgi:UDP-N-acetylglucosamine--N-acetylmuramyl-(pentapeptide) pyrophosphoryl-undecaprenol N-acetylglucosamine transferase